MLQGCALGYYQVQEEQRKLERVLLGSQNNPYSCLYVWIFNENQKEKRFLKEVIVYLCNLMCYLFNTFFFPPQKLWEIGAWKQN